MAPPLPRVRRASKSRLPRGEKALGQCSAGSWPTGLRGRWARSEPPRLGRLGLHRRIETRSLPTVKPRNTPSARAILLSPSRREGHPRRRAGEDEPAIATGGSGRALGALAAIRLAEGALRGDGRGGRLTRATLRRTGGDRLSPSEPARALRAASRGCSCASRVVVVRTVEILAFHGEVAHELDQTRQALLGGAEGAQSSQWRFSQGW